ncbi:hypothetical protein BT93_A1621 [Corymbia citriodora subsp. variegata]|nr:hypothetical protein BT93_A1621 [Corymbia citriodora subsp. variegata]
MNPATHLWWNFHTYMMYENARIDNQEAERERYYNAFTRAAANLTESVRLIKQNELLVLSSIAEATAFIAVWPRFVDDRGNLRRVQIENMSKQSRKRVRGWLEDRGFTIQDMQFIFNTPPQ